MRPPQSLVPPTQPPQEQQQTQPRGQPIDVDSQVIPAIKNAGKGPNEPQEYEENKLEGEQAEPIAGKHSKAAEPLIPVFGEPTIRKLFSTKWQFRSDALEEIERATIQEPERHFGDALNAVSIGISDKIATVGSKALSTFENLLNMIGNVQMNGMIKQQMDQIAMSLMDRLGDNNKNVKDHAERLAIQLTDHPVAGTSFILGHIARAQKEKKKTSSSTKHQVGRLKLLNEIVQKGGLSGGDQKLATEYAIVGYKNSNKDIRNEAQATLMSLYREMGEKLKTYLTDIRKAQLEVLQDGFDEIDGVDPEDRKSKAPPSNDEPTVTTNINPGGAQGKKKKTTAKAQPVQDPDKTCQYCGKFDENFDENSMDMHCFQECPMLCECPGCSQMLEIPDLNYHLMEDCEAAHAFKQCPRCKEPIEAGVFDQHVDEELCNVFQPPNKANRCPLCHEDIRPGDEGWKHHIMEQTCPNNPRHP